MIFSATKIEMKSANFQYFTLLPDVYQQMLSEKTDGISGRILLFTLFFSLLTYSKIRAYVESSRTRILGILF